MQIPKDTLASARGMLLAVAQKFVDDNFADVPQKRREVLARELLESLDFAYQEGWGDGQEDMGRAKTSVK